MPMFHSLQSTSCDNEKTNSLQAWKKRGKKQKATNKWKIKRKKEENGELMPEAIVRFL